MKTKLKRALMDLVNAGLLDPEEGCGLIFGQKVGDVVKQLIEENDNLVDDLRDRFAAKAMAGLLTAPATEGNEPYDLNNDTHIMGTTVDSYKFADAMLVARAKDSKKDSVESTE